MNIATNPSGALSSSGTRHPQVSISWFDSQVCNPVTIRPAATKPARLPRGKNPTTLPRVRSGACSTMYVIAPTYSPPVESPWNTRATTSRIGAHTPMVLYPGNSPVPVVPIVISTIVITRTRLRPMRSPRGPKISPPIGRTTNAAARVLKVANRWTALTLLPG